MTTMNRLAGISAAITVSLLTGTIGAEPVAEFVTITTWNMEHLGTLGRGFGGGFGGFGRGSVPERIQPLPRRTDSDLEKIAHLIVSDLGSDILALQEIGITGLRRGRSLSGPLSKIVANLDKSGGRWVYFLPQVVETPAEDAEDNVYLGFLWNRNRVRLVNIFEMSLNDQGLAGKALFARKPLVAYFETIRADGSHGNDFVLVNVHLASGQGNDENHLIAVTMLEYELLRNMAAHAVSESDVIVLGDFNDNPTQTRNDGSPMFSPAMHEHMIFKGYVDLVTPDLKTTRMNRALDSLIDHIFVNKYAQSYLLQDRATIYLPGGSLENTEILGEWRQSFSDHFPLSFKFAVQSDTDTDFFD